jgi:hypothetical protein
MKKNRARFPYIDNALFSVAGTYKAILTKTNPPTPGSESARLIVAESEEDARAAAEQLAETLGLHFCSISGNLGLVYVSLKACEAILVADGRLESQVVK